MNARFLLILGAMGLAPSLLLAADFSSLEELMTLDQFKKAGLEQLSSEQLQYLNRWLEQHGDMPESDARPEVEAAATRPAVESATTRPVEASPAPAVEASPAASQNDDQTGFVAKDSQRADIHSTIKGEFKGWSGRTRFNLANGQIWQQVGSGNYNYHALNPAVVIKPKFMGSWKLYIDGRNRGVNVKRIR